MIRPSVLAIFTTISLVSAPKPVFDNEFAPLRYDDTPKVWELEIPKGVKRVEIVFVSETKGEKSYTAECGRMGLLKINGKDVIKWLRRQDDGINVYQNLFTGAEFKSSDKSASEWIDVSAAVQMGKNEFHYFHRASTKMGLRVQGWRK